jgi:hypothetical protein
VRWTLEFEPGPARTVEIAATWLAGAGHASNAPYRVYDDQENPLWADPVRVDQSAAPADFQQLGVMWSRLGRVDLAEGQTTLYVELATDGIDGYVLADAVWAGPAPDLLRLAGAPLADDAAQPVLPASFEPLLTAATARWAAAGATTAELDRLGDVQVIVADLPGALLGETSAAQNTIWIDSNAAGYGWFLDGTPELHEEFTSGGSANQWLAREGGPADGRVDLLTVLAHELGHVLGREHTDEQDPGYDVMDAALAVGERRLPGTPYELPQPNHAGSWAAARDTDRRVWRPEELHPVFTADRLSASAQIRVSGEHETRRATLTDLLFARAENEPRQSARRSTEDAPSTDNRHREETWAATEMSRWLWDGWG